MAGIKRAAREADRPIAKKARVYNGTKANPVGNRAVTTERLKAQTSDSMPESNALSDSDGGDLDSESDFDNEAKEPHVESKLKGTLKEAGENGDGSNETVNGNTRLLQRYRPS